MEIIRLAAFDEVAAEMARLRAANTAMLAALKGLITALEPYEISDQVDAALDVACALVEQADQLSQREGAADAAIGGGT